MIEEAKPKIFARLATQLITNRGHRLLFSKSNISVGVINAVTKKKTRLTRHIFNSMKTFKSYFLSPGRWFLFKFQEAKTEQTVKIHFTATLCGLN